MEQAMVLTLIITLLIGVSQEQGLLPPGPIYKKVTENVLFTTIASPDPIIAIRWHFNGTDVVKYTHPGLETVDPNYKDRVILKIYSGELELKDLTTADSGEYTLTLTFDNGLGFKDHTFLQVFEPVFSFGIVGPEDSVVENGSANLNCKGNGSISTIVWMKEGVVLTPSSSITFLDDNTTLLIIPVKRSDSGDYQCTMSNPVSSSTGNYSFTVNYGPDVRILGAKILDEGSDLLLLCSPDSVPPAIVTWTVKDMSAGNAPLYVTENSKPSDSGDYECTCWNNVTGITAVAVQVVTVKAVSFRLCPGVEAGITLGVIFAVVILGLLIYCLLFKRVKKPAITGNEAPRMANQQINPTSHCNCVVGDTPTTSTAFTKKRHDKVETVEQPFYLNRQPTPPPKNPPPLPPNRKPNDSDLYCSAIE